MHIECPPRTTRSNLARLEKRFSDRPATRQSLIKCPGKYLRDLVGNLSDSADIVRNALTQKRTVKGAHCGVRASGGRIIRTLLAASCWLNRTGRMARVCNNQPGKLDTGYIILNVPGGKYAVVKLPT